MTLHCLFVSKVGRHFIFLRVDDLLIFSEKQCLQPLVDVILNNFERHDLKELSYVLGMEVQSDQEAKTLTISHKKMITNLLDRNKMLGCRSSSTPLEPKDQNMSRSQDPTQEKALMS